MNTHHDRMPLSPLRRSALGALAAASLVACGGAPSTSSGPPATAPADGSPGGAAAASIAAPADESAKAPAATPVQNEPPKKSPFIAVAQYSQPLRIFAVDGALLVLPQASNFEPVRFGVLEGDKIEFLDRLTAPGWYLHVVAVAGKWPDKVDFLATGSTGRTGIAERYTLTPNGWKPHSSRMGERFVGMAPIGSGMVGLTTPVMWGSPQLIPMYGATGPRRQLAPVPKSCIPEGAVPGAFGVPPAALIPTGLGSTKNGTLIAVGEHCEHGPALEIWVPGAKKSKIVVIPGAPPGGGWDVTTRVVAGTQPDEAFVLNGYVAHVVGEKVSILEGMGGLFGGVTPDGALWTFDGGRVLKYADAHVEVVTAPHGVELEELAVGPDGTVWVTGNGALFRLRRENESGSGVQVDTKKKVIPAVFRLPRPGGPQCENNLVVLYGFTKVTPVDYDFPLTRKALKGHTQFRQVQFAVTEDNGKKYLTGAAPNFDVAKKLMKHIEKGVKGARPTIVCVKPKVIRAFPLNLRTGELAP